MSWVVVPSLHSCQSQASQTQTATQKLNFCNTDSFVSVLCFLDVACQQVSDLSQTLTALVCLHGVSKGRSNSYLYFTPRMFFVSLPSENQKQKQDHLWVTAQEDWGGASVSPRASGPWWAAGCWLGEHLCGVWPAWCHGCRSWWGKGICAVPSTNRELGRYCLALTAL